MSPSLADKEWNLPFPDLWSHCAHALVFDPVRRDFADTIINKRDTVANPKYFIVFDIFLYLPFMAICSF